MAKKEKENMKKLLPTKREVCSCLVPTTDHPVCCSSKINDQNHVPTYNHNAFFLSFKAK